MPQRQEMVFPLHFPINKYITPSVLRIKDSEDITNKDSEFFTWEVTISSRIHFNDDGFSVEKLNFNLTSKRH